MGLIALAWLAGAALIVGLLAWVFPAFREFLSLGAYQAPPKATRAQRAAVDRAQRRRERANPLGTNHRVRVPLIDADGLSVTEIEKRMLRIVPERGLEVRRHGETTSVEFTVIGDSPITAIRTADRLVAHAELRPGAAHVVSNP